MGQNIAWVMAVLKSGVSAHSAAGLSGYAPCRLRCHGPSALIPHAFAPAALRALLARNPTSQLPGYAVDVLVLGSGGRGKYSIAYAIFCGSITHQWSTAFINETWNSIRERCSEYLYLPS